MGKGSFGLPLRSASCRKKKTIPRRLVAIAIRSSRFGWRSPSLDLVMGLLFFSVFHCFTRLTRTDRPRLELGVGRNAAALHIDSSGQKSAAHARRVVGSPHSQRKKKKDYLLQLADINILILISTKLVRIKRTDLVVNRRSHLADINIYTSFYRTSPDLKNW